MRILVTGGCGFIGSNLIPMLIDRGDHIRVLDNLTSGNADVLNDYDVDLQIGDICDPDMVKRAIRDRDGVIHLAAHTSVIDSQKYPLENFNVNVQGIMNLLMASKENDVGTFVFASSNAPIGETTPPIDESKPHHPLSPYGASKLAGEGYCTAFNASYGLQTTILRFANVYGPRSRHKGSVVAQFIKDALNDGQIIIYGNGKQTRDFIYVDDLCRSILSCLDLDMGGETFQIATGCETRIIDLAEMICKKMPDRSINVIYKDQRAGEIIKNYSSIDKARRILKWEPLIHLNEGLSRTVEYFRQIDTQ